MSKPRISIELEVDTLAHAENIRTAIENRIAGKDIFELHGLAAYLDSENGKNVVICGIRFNQRIDRDDALAWIKDQVRNHPQIKNWVLAARVESHLCSHDDAEVKDCRTTEFVEWAR